MDNAIIIYCSYSGNTEEVADLIGQTLMNVGVEVEMYRIGSGFIPELSTYDICFVGTFTWEEGGVPEEIDDWLEYSNLPKNTAMFGTGDTQFGGDTLFCKAVDTIATRYRTRYIPLKVEQSPRGSQEEKVYRWTNQIIELNQGGRQIDRKTYTS